MRSSNACLVQASRQVTSRLKRFLLTLELTRLLLFAVPHTDLTGLGQDQAKSLNSILVGGGWYAKMTADRPARFIISPLTRYSSGGQCV